MSFGNGVHLETVAAAHILDEDDPSRLTWKEMKDNWGETTDTFGPCCNFMLSHNLNPYNHQDFKEALVISKAMKKDAREGIATNFSTGPGGKFFPADDREEKSKSKDDQGEKSKPKDYQEEKSKAKDDQGEKSKSKDDQEEKSKSKDDQGEKSKAKDDQGEKSKAKDDQGEKSKSKDDQEEKSKSKDDQEEKSKSKDDQEEKSKSKDDQKEKGNAKDDQKAGTNSSNTQKADHEENGEPEGPTEPNMDYNSLCWSCSKTKSVVKLYKCGGCKKARYCTRECIQRDWPVHENYCLKQQEKREIRLILKLECEAQKGV